MSHPKHVKAKHVSESGLFAGIQNFAMLEERIAALPAEQGRGAAFEVFAEACLATQRIYQAREVWPGNSMPSALRQQLRLPLVDMGVDGVFVTPTDEAVCYQSKFRTRRPTLSWSELSTFYGLVDAGGNRLVFTNCDEIASVAQERLGAIFVRGCDLDRLTAEDFRIIEAWLAERPAEPKKKEPKPHQAAALSDIVESLTRGPRATALMACGSGKTLVALWAAEGLLARTILILLPSLALVRQTLHEWLHETNWPDVRFLCVCSDATVQSDEDSLLVRASDLDFAVTTESGKVRQFMEHETNSVRLVFSTYQSSHVVAAAVTGLSPFDLGVFDEAHKTAGRDGAKFSLALKDDSLCITRRLFLTATPRHYDVARKDKFGESKVVFSMDAVDVYGPIAHRLPFSAAAKAGIITDYKVIISVVTSEMVTDQALRLGVVLVEGDEVKARQVANQIAVKSAIEKYGVSKVFTFHSKVSAAKSFTSTGAEGVGTHLEGFHCAHIEGAMSTVYRERLLREFAAAPRAILSNARCLTEGVDVPAVDMVAFLSPKRSLVDIVQATGRAMRLSPGTGKQVGYVLVPLYVEKARGETIEEAVLRSNFDEVWRVLQGLKEQDDLLAQIVAEMRIERGRTGGFDDSRFRERVEVLGPELSLEILRQTITAACLDAVGEQWFERYGQLVAYKQTHGDCDMPARWKENQKLATWLVDQRVRRRDGNLEPEKIELLNRLGFNWNPRETNWRGAYLELVKFQKRFGHCRVPQNWKENNSLAHWVKTQRMDHANSELHGDRVVLLEKIGFEWVVDRSTWDDRFADLCAFNERFGHCLVPVRWDENRLLGSWVVRQRCLRRKGKLQERLVERLDSIGFEWDARTVAKTSEKRISDPDKQWREAFERFKNHAASHGTEVIRVVDAETKKLNRWMLYQRQAMKRGVLSKARVDALNEIGFVWIRNNRRARPPSIRKGRQESPPSLSWEQMFSALVDFYKLQGHTNVPEDWPPQPYLEAWCAAQRRAKRKGVLAPAQASQMDEIGFSWHLGDGSWDSMFVKLADHLRPMHNGKRRDAKLSDGLKRWMLTQRQAKKRGDLDPLREKRLSSVGFDWEPYSSRWEKMFAQLRDFQAVHGHCRVPAGWPKNPVLANWVGVQRARRLAGKLSAERHELLSALGFSWRLGEFVGTRSPQEAWENMLQRLKTFHAAHGHSSVPQVFPEDQKLGWWVTTQRRNRRRGKLTAGQINALERLKFIWSPFGSTDSNGRWQSMLDALKAFQKEFGHCRVPAGWLRNPKLANWVAVQRRQFQEGKLSEDRKAELNALGFVWNVNSRGKSDFVGEEPIDSDARWRQRFSELEAYKQANGDCRVPSGWRQNAQLANWVAVQRRRYKQGKLTAMRVELLQSLGFDWSVDPNSERFFDSSTCELKEPHWNDMFEKLVDYKETHGNCRVPQRWRHDRRLADWVSNQRSHYHRGLISSDRVERLEQIGFEWDPVATRWEEMFQRLLEFQKLNGHTNVPQRASQYAELATWVRNQRAAKERNRPIMGERAKRLDEIGFTWRLVEPEAWHRMLERLIEFKQLHGHCNVPQKGGKDKRLGKWVNTQRTHFKQGKLKPERVQQLEAVGFVWNVKPTPRGKR